MCEYVPVSEPFPVKRVSVPDEGLDVSGMIIRDLPDRHKGFWECWHPETDSWEAMYPPPPGMGLHMSTGSKIRLNTTDPRPEHTKNPPPPETIPAGTQMRDLIPANT
jgi:hypothetical protein